MEQRSAKGADMVGTDRRDSLGVVRPLRADAQRNRARVLEAAEMLFATVGPAAPIDEIARRAGVGVGTVYRQFPTKETLFEAIILERLVRLVDEARALGADDDPGSAFFGFLHRMVEQALAKRDLADALCRAGVDVKTLAPGTVHDLRHAVEELLVRAQRAGAVRDDVGMEELFLLVGGTCMAVERSSCALSSSLQMLAIVCDGLRPPAAPSAEPPRKVLPTR